MRRCLFGFPLGIAVLMSCCAASAQQAGIPGLLTPQGTFRPMAAPQQPAAPATFAYYSGTYNVTLNITIASDAAHLDPSTLNCTLSVLAIDLNFGSSFIESDTVAATVSGTTATCQLAIPYSWRFNPNDTVQVQIGYTVTGTGNGSIGRTTSASGIVTEPAATNGTKTYKLNTRI